MRRINRCSFCDAVRGEEGATATEYGLVALLVSTATIGAYLFLGDTVTGLYVSEAKMIDRVVATVLDRSRH
jgi:Flp pilus assembly pilin Flp